MDLDAAIGALGGSKPQSVAKPLADARSRISAEPMGDQPVSDAQFMANAVHGGGDDLSGAIDALSGAPTKAAAAPAAAQAPAASTKAPASAAALPDTTVGRIAAGALGEAKGAFDIAVEGPAQFLAHAATAIYPSNWPGAEFLQSQQNVAETGRKARQAAFEEATANVPTSAKAGEIAGGIVGAMALPGGKAAEGANLLNRMIAAAKTGGVIGLATPTDDKDFWTNKALQTGLSAATAFLAQPIAEGVGKLAGMAADTALNTGRRVLNWATGKAPDPAIAAAMQKASPELKAAIQQATSGGAKVDPAALGRQLEADALPVRMSLTAGQATQDPHLLSAEINTRGGPNAAMAYKMQSQERDLFANLHAIRDNAAPQATAPDAITAGSQLIKAGEDTLAKQREMTSALYKKLTDANGGALPVDGESFVNDAQAALKKQMKSPFLPSEVRQIMDGIKDAKGQMTFENFENMRTILAAAGRKAARAGDGNTEAAVSIVRDALENAPMSEGAAQVKPLADAARASAKFGFDMLRNNPALKAIESGKAADNTFVQKYIIGASQKDLENLASALGHDPVALQTIKAGTVNYLEQAATRGGNFTQAGYNKAMQALGPKIDSIFGPEEAAQLRTLGNVARYTQLAPRGAYVNASNTDVANMARAGGGMAARFIDRVFGVPVGSAAAAAAETAMERRATQKTLGQITNLGAGVAQPSNASEFLLGRFPRIAGTAASVPLSVMAGKAVAEKSRQQAREGQ